MAARNEKKETFYFDCGNMPKRHSDILTRERSIWNQIGIKKTLRNFGECGKLHRLFLGTFGRRIGVELPIEPATSKFSVSFPQT